MYSWAILAVLLAAVAASRGRDFGELDIPSSVANRTMSIKGQLFCGKKPFEGAKIRLFRTYQKNTDDLAQLLDSTQTYITGMFQVSGNTGKFPSTQSEIQPFVTIHHNCGLDGKQTANLGYKRWAVRLPEDYVTVSTKVIKTYDFGKINLEIEYPGEKHDKKFNMND